MKYESPKDVRQWTEESKAKLVILKFEEKQKCSDVENSVHLFQHFQTPYIFFFLNKHALNEFVFINIQKYACIKRTMFLWHSNFSYRRNWNLLIS